MIIKTASNASDFCKQAGFCGKLPLFFLDAYKSYVTLNKSSHKEYVIIFSRRYAIPVLIRKYLVFCYAEFLAAPFEYEHNEESLKDFLNELTTFLKKKLKVQWLLATPVHSIFDDYPTHAKVIRFADTEIDLTKTEDEIISNFNKKFQNAIRHAEKCDTQFRIGGKDLIEDFEKIETATWNRSGVTVDHTKDSYYNDVFKCLSDNIVVIISYDKDGQPAAGLVRLYDSDCAYGILSARANKIERGTVNFTHWQLIKWLKSKGVSKYIIAGYRLKVDPGSKIESIQQFKDNFNGYHHEGFMFRQTYNKQMHYLYGKVTRLFGLIRTGKIIKQSPDIIAQEIVKWPEYND